MLVYLYLYADDSQLDDHLLLSDISAAIPKMENCVAAVPKWCASKRLQLNLSKTEVIWFSTNANLKNPQSINISLNVGIDIIVPVDAVHDLGVILDGELTMVKHIAKITSVCCYPIRCLKQVRRILGPEIVAWLVSAYVISRLDYSNSVLAGLPKASMLL